MFLEEEDSEKRNKREGALRDWGGLLEDWMTGLNRRLSSDGCRTGDCGTQGYKLKEL